MVQIAHLDRLEVVERTDGGLRGLGGHRRSDTDAWFGWAAGLAAFAVYLLLAQPALPLKEDLNPGPMTMGWLLLAGILVLLLGRRALRRSREHRMRLWLSAPHLALAVDRLAEALSFRYGGDERWDLIRNPEPVEVTWWEGGGGEEAESPGPGGGSIAAYFHRTRAGRLVVLGGPGSGKSVLALRLATELLRERQTHEGQGPVPVILSLASWDPREGLFTWIARQVAVDHPYACTPVPGAPPITVALALLRTRQVLPILDGFDELPHEVRKRAMRRLRDGTKGGVPFVLTSRQAEYHEHAPEQNVFTRTEINLRPLEYSAVAAYLNPGGGKSRWTEVLARLDGAAADSPEARLRDVLRVPLMANLAREAYSDDDAHPSALIAPGAFADTAAIEYHLYGAYLDAIYSPTHEERTGWDPETARAWAGFLAARMKARNLEQLAWWRLDEHVPRRVRVLALVPEFALSVALMARLDLGAWGWPAHLGLSLWQAYAIVCALALLHTCASAENAENRLPHQIVRPTGTRLREAMSERRGRVLGMCAVAGLAAGWATTAFTRSGLWLWSMTAISWVSLRWCGRRLLLAADDPSLARSPRALLRSDRRAVCTLGWLFSAGPPVLTVLCVLPLPLLAIWFAGDAEGPAFGLDADTGAVRFLVDVLNAPQLLLFGFASGAWSYRDRLVPLTLVIPLVTLALYAVTPAAQGMVAADDWVFTTVGTLVCWSLHGMAVSSWGRLQLARSYLAATGSLPLRLITFLEDAHQRGVLRQAGGVYSFRHVELRDRLAQGAVEQMRAGARQLGRASRFMSAALALALMVGLYAVTLRGAAQAELVTGPVRSLPSACRLLDPRHIAALTEDPVTHAPRAAEDTVFGWQPDCVVGERSPSARTVRIEIGTHVVGPALERSAVRTAAQIFDSTRSSYFGLSPLAVQVSRRLGNLGDEAHLYVGRRYVDDVERLSSPVAVIQVRKDNALVTVCYTEQNAGQARVIDVAEVLARTALRKAALAPT
ncbi:NACHT domain-containing protein [Streptomyces fungicidicus]|uniref:NACHT domain-containing protein n=1 Tax=Streptomyces fungicidicus TaxID=68203 RepID=UPI0036404DDB